MPTILGKTKMLFFHDKHRKKIALVEDILKSTLSICLFKQVNCCVLATSASVFALIRVYLYHTHTHTKLYNYFTIAHFAPYLLLKFIWLLFLFFSLSRSHETLAKPVLFCCCCFFSQLLIFFFIWVNGCFIFLLVIIISHIWLYV